MDDAELKAYLAELVYQEMRAFYLIYAPERLRPEHRPRSMVNPNALDLIAKC